MVPPTALRKRMAREFPMWRGLTAPSAGARPRTTEAAANCFRAATSVAKGAALTATASSMAGPGRRCPVRNDYFLWTLAVAFLIGYVLFLIINHRAIVAWIVRG